MIPRPLCGEVTSHFPLWSKVSGFWAHLWGHPDYVRAQLASQSGVHDELIPDLQFA